MVGRAQLDKYVKNLMCLRLWMPLSMRTWKF